MNSKMLLLNKQKGGGIPSDYIAYYPFNGNANDESGNGYNGTVFDATLTSDRHLESDKAYLFNGTSAFISTTYGYTHGTEAFSIVFWFKTSATGLNTVCYIGSTLKSEGFVVDIRDTFLQIRGGATNTMNSAIGGLNDDLWHFGVIMFDANSLFSDVIMYIDGVAIGTTGSGNNLINISDAFFQIGKDRRANTYFFDGKLDDIIIYNRLLTEDEITDLYNY